MISPARWPWISEADTDEQSGFDLQEHVVWAAVCPRSWYTIADPCRWLHMVQKRSEVVSRVWPENRTLTENSFWTISNTRRLKLGKALHFSNGFCLQLVRNYELTTTCSRLLLLCPARVFLLRCNEMYQINFLCGILTLSLFSYFSSSHYLLSCSLSQDITIDISFVPVLPPFLQFVKTCYSRWRWKSFAVIFTRK